MDIDSVLKAHGFGSGQIISPGELIIATDVWTDGTSSTNSETYAPISKTITISTPGLYRFAVRVKKSDLANQGYMTMFKNGVKIGVDTSVTTTPGTTLTTDFSANVGDKFQVYGRHVSKTGSGATLFGDMSVGILKPIISIS